MKFTSLELVVLINRRTSPTDIPVTHITSSQSKCCSTRTAIASAFGEDTSRVDIMYRKTTKRNGIPLTLKPEAELGILFSLEASDNKVNPIIFLTDKDPTANLSWCPDTCQSRYDKGVNKQ